MKRWTNIKKGGNFTVTQKKQTLICLALSHPACWFKPIVTLTNTLTYRTTLLDKISFNLGRRASFAMERANDKKDKIWSIKWHNTIPFSFFKGLLNIPVSREGCTREFRFWVAKEQARQLCSHNSHARAFPQYLRGPAFLNPARHIFAALHLDRAKAKRSQDSATPLTFLSRQGLKRWTRGRRRESPRQRSPAPVAARAAAARDWHR